MPVLRPAQVKKSDDLLALSSPAAGPIESFDAALAQLDPTEKDVALRAAGRRLRHAEERIGKLQGVAEAVAALDEAAAYRGLVVDVRHRNGHASGRVHLVLLGPQTHLVAGVLPGVAIADIKAGDEVDVVQSGPQHYAVRAHIGPHRRRGPIARIEEVLSAELLRVARGGDTLMLRAVGAAADTIATAAGDTRDLLGRAVSFDEHLGLAFDVFGEPERAQLQTSELPNVQRDQLVLAPAVARRIEEQIILPHRHAAEARDDGVRPVMFWIFAGDTGVGKTETARWIATELGRPVYLVNGADLASEWYGVTEQRLRARIRAAEAEPGGAVLVWDEAESLLVERGRSMVGVEDRIVATMLTATDGFTKSQNVLFILTTNRVDRIDEALRRSLRAETIRFERPDAPRTRALFRLYLRDARTVDDGPEALADIATRAIFAESEPLAFATLNDGGRLPLTRAMAVSGALVRGACERARRKAFVRRIRANGDGEAARGLRVGDLRAAIDEEIAGVAGTLTLSNVARVLTLPPGSIERMVAITPNANTAHRYVGGR